MYLQQITEFIDNSKQALRAKNTAQKVMLRQQSDHLKRAYLTKIDHEVNLEIRNLEQQANDELVQLQHDATHCRAMLEQHATIAAYECSKLRSAESLRKVRAGETEEAMLEEPPTPTVSLISAYKDIVSLPHPATPAITPPKMQNLAIMCDTDNLLGVTTRELVASTGTAASQQRSLPSSAVPVPLAVSAPVAVPVRAVPSPSPSYVPPTALAGSVDVDPFPPSELSALPSATFSGAQSTNSQMSPIVSASASVAVPLGPQSAQVVAAARLLRS